MLHNVPPWIAAFAALCLLGLAFCHAVDAWEAFCFRDNQRGEQSDTSDRNRAFKADPPEEL